MDKPQGSRGKLNPESLLPNDDDEQLFRERAQLAVMQVLTTHFKSFKHLKLLVTDKRMAYQAEESEIHPLALMDIDESLIDNNIEILLQFAKDLGLKGDRQQCVVGDQASCVTIRGAKRRRIDDITPLEKLVWAKENPGDFHFLWECLRVIFILFWGSATEIGSLSSLKLLLNRKKVDKDAKQFQSSDEFQHHVMEAYLVASLTCFLGMQTPEQEPPSTGTGISFQWLTDQARDFVEQVVAVPRDHTEVGADQIFNRHRCYLHASLLYHDLRNAIRCEDGPSIIAQWRWWLVYFLASKRTNYSQEAANLLANLKSNFSERMAYIVTHNRTVNVSGHPGRGKPIDMAIEHHNLILKNALRSSGLNVTQEHLTTISLASQQLHEAAVLCDKELYIPANDGDHTETGYQNDIKIMTESMLQNKVTKKISGRHIQPSQLFEPPFDIGWSVATGKQWIKKFLRKTETIADFECDERESHQDMEDIDSIEDLPL